MLSMYSVSWTIIFYMVLSSSVTCNYIAVICVWLAKPDVTANTRNSLNVQTKVVFIWTKGWGECNLFGRIRSLCFVKHCNDTWFKKWYIYIVVYSCLILSTSQRFSDIIEYIGDLETLGFTQITTHKGFCKFLIAFFFYYVIGSIKILHVSKAPCNFVPFIHVKSQ